MTLVRYNPLNDYVSGTFGDLIESVLREPQKSNGSFRPTVDIFKDDKQIEVQLIVPGMKKEDFSIDLSDQQLVISGERKLDEAAKERLQKKESAYGQFSRAFTLSDEVDQEKIKASYKDGILHLELPLKEKKESKSTIKVM